MNYDYLGSCHNKVIKRKKIIYKFYKSDKKYKTEKSFYITTKDKFNFIPKLYYYSDKRKLLIIQNVGKPIKKKEFLENKEKIKHLSDIIIHKSNYYHNDLWYRNVVKENNNYYIIDWESCTKFNSKDIHKRSKEIYII